MNKAEHKFHRDKRERIDNQARENKPFGWGRNESQPIFIPKKKKKK